MWLLFDRIMLCEFIATCFIPLGAAFDYLDGPILRVSAADVPTPYCQNLEVLSVPQTNNVVKTVRKLLNV